MQYVLNLYEILDRLRAKHPNLEIESCSGGGGRIDLGILQRVDEVWPSDNTDAFDRQRIQEGFSMAYPAKIMSAWVTDVPNMNTRSTPLAFRFLIAMQGALGVGSNLNKFSEADSTLATNMIAAYKRIRATVQTGDLYRLGQPAHQRRHGESVRGSRRQAGRGLRPPPLAAVQHRRAHHPSARPRRTRALQAGIREQQADGTAAPAKRRLPDAAPAST